MAKYDSKQPPERIQNLIGNTYNRLTVVGYSHVKRYKSGGRRHYWLCRCVCGNPNTVSGNDLKTDNVKSCGCLAIERTRKMGKANRTHGMSNSPEWLAWRNMQLRCYDENRDGYHRYGGRGIEVCKRWRDSFEAFYEDMGPRPGPRYSVDRIDNDGNYEPENCRWATPRQQANKRHDVRQIEYDGETRTMTQWARHLGMNPGTLSNRINTLRWPIERALTEPVHNG